MHTDLFIQQIHAAHLDSKRLDDVLQNEQLRIARETRPSLALRLMGMIGSMLITTGEWLRQEPATSETSGARKATAHQAG